jgi:hypothetical protein
MADSDRNEGFKLRDDAALPARLRLVQTLTDKLATSRCPVPGHSLAEVLCKIPPMILADPALVALSNHGESSKRVVETTPAKKQSPEMPTHSPGGETTMADQLHALQPLQASQWQLMKQSACAVIRQNLCSTSLADIAGISSSNPKQMVFALTGLISEDPAEQIEEIMEEIDSVTLLDPLDFNVVWADLAAMKNFMDNIPGAKVKKADKRKWAKLLAKKFAKAFPAIKQMEQTRKFNGGKALKATEVIQLAKMGLQEAKQANKAKRKQAKQQQVLIKKSGHAAGGKAISPGRRRQQQPRLQRTRLRQRTTF